jgi:hypothetical protein
VRDGSQMSGLTNTHTHTHTHSRTLTHTHTLLHHLLLLEFVVLSLLQLAQKAHANAHDVVRVGGTVVQIVVLERERERESE